jgi:hypothetical protein
MGRAIPAFEAMYDVWKQCQEDYPEMAESITEGLDKLEQYMNRMDLVPAHISAMSKFLFNCSFRSGFRSGIVVLFIVVEPGIKLAWYNENMSDRRHDAKRKFIDAVSLYFGQYSHSTILRSAPALPCRDDRTARNIRADNSTTSRE